MSAEADKQGLSTNNKAEHIRATLNPYKKRRADERDAAVSKRVEELKIEIPEAIKKCKTVSDLPACVNDIKWMLNFLVEVMGVKPKDVRLLVTNDVFSQFVKHISVESECKKTGIQYFLEAKDDEELEKWLKCPFQNVPETLLPAIKASFLCYAQENREELT